MERTEASFSLGTPGTYAIQVRGWLDTTWSDQLGGMRIAVTESGERPVTMLIGRLTDQAALLGVLNSLYELGLPLLSVEYIPPP